MKEIRSIERSEFRIVPESRKVEGYALLFNTLSNDLGGFREIIMPEAMNGVIEKSDILALYNHEDDKVLARATNGKGTLALNVDEQGLKYSFSAPMTPTGEEVFSAINRGDLRNSSFAFTLAENGQKWSKDENGKYVRTITQFDLLFDVSPVYRPAYSDTSVALRSMEDLEKNIKDMEERQKIEVKVEVEVCDDPEIEDPNIPDPTEDPTADPTEDPNMPMEDNALTTETTTCDPEQLEVVIEGQTYRVPKSVLDPYIRTVKLEKYFDNLAQSISQLKK